MAVVLINPNSTVSMTYAALAAAQVAAPGLAIEGWTSLLGPPAIEGEADGRAAVPPLLDLVARADLSGAEGIVIACFDDTGLAEARAVSSCPVIGIGQAAFVIASLLSDRFAVVTTVEAAVPVIEGNIRASGYAAGLTGVLASGVGVLDLEGETAIDRVTATVLRARDAGAGVVVLGCAGMVSIIDEVRARTGMPLIDGVTAAARLMQAQLGCLGTVAAPSRTAEAAPT